METPILEVKDLRVQYGAYTAIEHVSFSVNRGDILAIVGPNGSGKSTLMKAMLGLIPHDGEVVRNIEGEIGYVPQYFHFDRSFPLTVYEMFLLKLHGSLWLPRRSARRRVIELLTEVHAAHLIDRELGALSGGELQRVLIAFALAKNPIALFFDEPSSGIDIGGEETIYMLIHELSEKKKLTILLISHDLDVVYEHATNVLCINKRMVCHGVPHVALSEGVIQKLYGHHTSVYEHEKKDTDHKHGKSESHAGHVEKETRVRGKKS